MGDSYRPGYHGRTRSQTGSVDRRGAPSSHTYQPPPPPPPNRDHYAPQPPSPGRDMYRFGAAQHNGPPEFGFSPPEQPHAPYPSLPPNRDTYRPEQTRAALRRRDQRINRRGGRQGDRNDGHSRPERPFRKRGAAERALLQTRRGSTPPQLRGMNEGGAVKYVNLDELSDMEEEDMEESEDENAPKEPTPPPKPTWSNPETYTALPPPDESQRKKKDMVKLIRKARVTAAENANSSSTNAVATNDDFISLDAGESEEEELIRPGVPGAPRGPAADQIHSHAAVKGIADQALDQLAAQPNVQSAKVEVVEVSDSVGTRLTALKRKRSITEAELEERDLRPPSKILKPMGTPNGAILSEWRGRPDMSSLPWIRKRKTPMPLPNVRLHQEVVDFHAFVSPKPYEHAVRLDLLKRLGDFMHRDHPGAEVHCFGSFAAGLYLPDADIDVTVLSRDFRERGYHVICQSGSQMYKLANRLKHAGLADVVEVISKAKVPIIKFVDRLTSIKVDMSFENPTGLAANKTFEGWKVTFPAMPIIVTIIKQFLLMRGLSDVVNGGIGGFSITCLVTSLLQLMPRVQTGELKPEQHLGEILLEFLDLYGNRFDFYRAAIRMSPPGYVPKDDLLRTGNIPKAQSDRLMILDPNNLDNDISGGSKNIRTILRKFSEARTSLLRAMPVGDSGSKGSPGGDGGHRPPQAALLSFMLGGNYDGFMWYRRHLKRVYEQKWGPVPEEDL